MLFTVLVENAVFAEFLTLTLLKNSMTFLLYRFKNCMMIPEAVGYNLEKQHLYNCYQKVCLISYMI